MNKRIFPLLFVFLLAFAPNAQSNSILFFSPQRIEIDDKNPIQELRLTNTTDIARAYSITIQNLVMTEEGGTAAVEDFEYSAKRMVRFVPRKFDLAPGKTQIIRIMARIPSDTPDGEFHSHIEFLEDIKRRGVLNKKDNDKTEVAKLQAQLSYSAAIPLTIAKGKIETAVTIKNAEIKTNKDGKHFVNLLLGREGNGQGKLFLEADYIAPDGTVTQAASRRTAYIYREISQKKHNFLLELLEGKTIDRNGSIRVKLYNREQSEDTPVQDVTVPLG